MSFQNEEALPLVEEQTVSTESKNSNRFIMLISCGILLVIGSFAALIYPQSIGIVSGSTNLGADQSDDPRPLALLPGPLFCASYFRPGDVIETPPGCVTFLKHALSEGDKRNSKSLLVCSAKEFGEVSIPIEILDQYGFILYGRAHMSEVQAGLNTVTTLYKAPDFTGVTFTIQMGGGDDAKKHEVKSLTAIKYHDNTLTNDNVYGVKFESKTDGMSQTECS